MKKSYLILIFLFGILVINSCQPKQEQLQQQSQPSIIETPEITESEEQIIEEAKPVTPILKEFIVEADDVGLYPDTLTVNKGDNVKITFKVRAEKVYYGGLDFRSDVWGDTGKVLPGDTTTVEFTAEETFEYKSYWPASNRLKAIGKIEVL
mgnify:CR=1 FL=1